MLINKKDLPDHAPMAPSNAEIWVNCPGSLPLSASIPDTGNKFSLQGSAAHHLAYKCAVSGENPYNYIGELDFDTNVTYDREMAHYVSKYLKYLEAIDGTKFYEYKLIHSGEHFGTADFIAVQGHKLTVVDFKYGIGVKVPIVDNLQLLSYASMAYDEFSILYPEITQVYAGIFQPRTSPENIGIQKISLGAVREFPNVIQSAMDLSKLNPPPYNTGDHCRFCRAKSICPAIANEARQLNKLSHEDINEMAAKMPIAELAELLNIAERLKSWIPELMETAKAHAQVGRTIPGWRLTQTRSNRAWVNEDEAAKQLRLLLPYADIFNRDLRSPAQIEKALKIAEIDPAFLDKLVTKNTGGTKLTRDKDAAPANADFDVLD